MTGWLRDAPRAVRRLRAGGREALAFLLGLPPAAARAGSVARGPGGASAAAIANPSRRSRFIAPLALQLLLAPALDLAQDVERVRFVVQQLVEAVGHDAAETLLHRGAYGGRGYGAPQSALHAAAATAGPRREPTQASLS